MVAIFDVSMEGIGKEGKEHQAALFDRVYRACEGKYIGEL